MSNYSKYIKYKKKYLDYKQLLINNKNIIMIGGKSLEYIWTGVWVPPHSTINGKKYTYQGNFKGSLSYPNEFIGDNTATINDKNIDITGKWEGEYKDDVFIGTFTKNESDEVKKYSWKMNKWELNEGSLSNSFKQQNIVIPSKEINTFTIYTTGIAYLVDGDKDENIEKGIILKKWTDEDGILENILKLIPEKYITVNIIHSDILIDRDTSEQDNISKKINEYIDNTNIKNKNNKNIKSIFTTNEFNWDNIETKPKNSYIIIDFAHIFNNIGQYEVKNSINGETYKLNSIYIGFPGDNFDYIYKSGLLFKVNEHNIETYIDYILKRKLYTGTITIEEFIIFPTSIFEKMIYTVKYQLYSKYNKNDVTRKENLEKIDSILKVNITEFGKFIMNRLIRYNDKYGEYLIHNLTADAFTSENMIKGRKVISFKERENANDKFPFTDSIELYKPFKYFDELFTDKDKKINKKNSYTIISIGGNDIRELLRRLSEPEILNNIIKEFHNNYEIIIDNIKKNCDKIIIMTQYRPDIDDNAANYKVYENINKISNNTLNRSQSVILNKIEKINILMEEFLYPEIFKLARDNKIPIADMSKTFNYDKHELYVRQIEPSGKGSKIISRLLSHVIYNHDFINGESILYSEDKDKKIKTLNNKESFVWGLKEYKQQ